MKKILTAILLLCIFALTGCIPEEPKSAKSAQSAIAAAAANSITFTENSEIDNIKARLQLTANPGLLGFIVLLNDMGQPVMYAGVKGKITSGAKRLTSTQRVGGYESHPYVIDSASDEGTYGHSGDYIFFWTTGGAYIQWNGHYLYSEKPFRLTASPLVVAVDKVLQ